MFDLALRDVIWASLLIYTLTDGHERVDKVTDFLKEGGLLSERRLRGDHSVDNDVIE